MVGLPMGISGLDAPRPRIEVTGMLIPPASTTLEPDGDLFTVWIGQRSARPRVRGRRPRRREAPLEILRWLCNVDKHRSVHVVGRTAFDLAPVIVESTSPLDVVDEWRHEGQVDDNTVVARLKLTRPLGNAPVDLHPTFAHLPTLQISDSPAEYRSLGSVMESLRDAVLRVLSYTTVLMGLPIPDMDGLEPGEEHDAVAAEYGGNVAVLPRSFLGWP
jgi:hypothetical protein